MDSIMQANLDRLRTLVDFVYVRIEGDYISEPFCMDCWRRECMVIINNIENVTLKGASWYEARSNQR